MRAMIVAGISAWAALTAQAAYSASVSVPTPPTNVSVPGYPVNLGTDVNR